MKRITLPEVWQCQLRDAKEELQKVKEDNLQLQN